MKKIALWTIVAGLVIFGAVAVSQREKPEPQPGPQTYQVQAPQAKEERVELSILPADTQQGEPARIVVKGAEAGEIGSLTFDGRPLGIFEYEGDPSALIGIDLRADTGRYPIVLTLADGLSFERTLVVAERPRIEAPLGIAPQLGGDTPEAERALLTNLARENAILEGIETADRALWQGGFAYPVKNPVITDEYGYTRLTGSSEIAHKGTDFRAPVGTPVHAMNSGFVRLARGFTVYGMTVAVDHGLGVQTLYMHLSDLEVEEGDRVDKGEIIGKAGKTGYAEFPHLHVSVKIGGVSIDPLKFLELF